MTASNCKVELALEPQRLINSVDAVRMEQRRRELDILRESLLLEMGVERLAESLQRYSDDIDRILSKVAPSIPESGHQQSGDVG